MNKVQAQSWLPADGMILEPNALDIAKGAVNNLVVAGPGAIGKEYNGALTVSFFE